MCDKAVSDFLPALKFVFDWSFTNEIIKKLHDILFANNDMFINGDSHNVTFLVVKWVYLV